MFASKNLRIHAARGAVGISAIGIAIYFAGDHPWVALAAIPIALIAFRGCPMCWTVGLFQTLLGKGCPDGTCSRDP
jgi:hypothetical protein